MSRTIVETESGRVEGRLDGGVRQWRGIPYAAPPVGRRRFAAPSPVEPWAGVRETSAFGPAAPQRLSPLDSALGGYGAPLDEDCLSLNIYAPASVEQPLPVMVWIHGGAFITGSGSLSWYDGRTFAASGEVVVVTINYRLGALGFLYLGEVAGEAYPTSGVNGILDQVAALRWVQDNIAGFGGDPGRVTVFGESAGAMSVGVLLGMPAAAGLFGQAILQSGTGEAVHSRERAAAVTAEVLGQLDVPLSRLPDVPVEALLDAQQMLTATATGLMSFRPVLDGVNLPVPPLDAVAAGSAAGIPMIVGTNRDELSLFTAFDPAVAALDEAGLAGAGAAYLDRETWDDLVDGYRRTRPDASPSSRLEAMLTDLVFRMPAIRLAEAVHGAGGTVWMYRFDFESPAFGGRLGATHALDVPFVWNVLDRPGAELFTGSGPGRHLLARRMHAAWTAFAVTGSPTTDLVPTWPAYEPRRRATLIFDEDIVLVDDPGGAERAVAGTTFALR